MASSEAERIVEMNPELKRALDLSLSVFAFVSAGFGTILYCIFSASVLFGLFGVGEVPSAQDLLFGLAAPAAFVITFVVQTFNLAYKKGKK